jgi:hypothetical protein
MQCKELEIVLEQEGLAPLPAPAREHLAGCAACQNFLADLSSLVAAAKELPAEANPPERIWISLRTQLEAEGIIRETAEVPVAASSSAAWQNLTALFWPRALATASVGLVLTVTAVFLSRQPVSPTSKTATPVAQSNTNSVVSPATSVPSQSASMVPSPAIPSGGRAVVSDPTGDLNRTEGDLANFHLAGTSPVDASLRQNLQTVNEFIAECELHLKQYPQDDMAREYLNSAYQQKAELLAAMMDSGRSEN